MTSFADVAGRQPRLAARFVDAPYVSNPEQARQKLRDWLASLTLEQTASIQNLMQEFPVAGNVLLGISDASPYLFDLLRADAGRALRVLECEPEQHLVAVQHADVRDQGRRCHRLTEQLTQRDPRVHGGSRRVDLRRRVLSLEREHRLHALRLHDLSLARARLLAPQVDHRGSTPCFARPRRHVSAAARRPDLAALVAG